MVEDQKHQTQHEEFDQVPENFFSRTDQAQELVKSLVNICREIYPEDTNRQHLVHNIPAHDLALHEKWLAEAFLFFREASLKELPLTFASEWLLDNYYVIRQTLQQIKEDLPVDFYKQLPKLSSGPYKGLPRIYLIARAVISYQHLLLDLTDLQIILTHFQEQVPLKMGEIWALPIFLRYCLIEYLSHSLVSTITPLTPPNLPLIIAQIPGIRDPLQTNKTATAESGNNDNVANSIIGLRIISEQNWSDFFESVSCLEKILQQDPAGIYPLMDFKTRDLYRKEIESLSFATGRDENELAEITLNLAHAAIMGSTPPYTEIELPPAPLEPMNKEVISAKVNPRSDRQAHIGEYLIGNGRNLLEAQLNYRPDFKTLYKRWIYRNASAIYLSSIGILCLVLLGILVFATSTLINSKVASSVVGGFTLFTPVGNNNFLFEWILIILLGLASLIPVMSIATSLINWLITLRIPPRILPKLDFKESIPGSFQTLVVIPAMITTQEDVDSLAHQIELHYLRNPEPGLLFALLTDFRDAESETLPGDASLIQYAETAIETLNNKYSYANSDAGDVGSSNEAGNDNLHEEGEKLFFFLHRKRLWNPSEHKWMGWERKRGKLHELNQLLRSGEALSFINISSESRKYLKSVRFVITLDSDTILPRGSACRLVGTLAHPLNRAVFNESTGQVVSGYTILQPRMEIHPKSANFSWFTRFFAGDAGLDLYTLAVSDAYQDLFGEGIYVGKGIYDVDAFDRSVNNKVPENAILSHDLLEGIMGRAALVTDITLIEDYPQNYFVQVMRQRRWIRGDWQLLPWLFKKKQAGLTFSSIDRWKMFDNLRRALLAPALMFIFISGLLFLPGLAGLGTLIVLLSLGVPLLTGVARSALQIAGGESPRIALQSLVWNFIRWILAIAFLPYEAYTSLDAVLTTLYRLMISHRNLLQWTTAAQTAHIFGLESRRKDAWQKMGASALLAALLTFGVQYLSGQPNSGLAAPLIFASPVLILWGVSPLIVWLINHPIIEVTIPLTENQVDLLRQITRRTWGFFERFVGPEDHWLRPDHFQESPAGIIAHHTSPTNIGLLLTSTLAAYDLGYLDQLGLATRLSTTMETLGQMERFKGHFINWYDTLTLDSLHPRYISTVDSGNLAASLIITAQACERIPMEPIFRWDLWQGYLDTLSNLTETLSGMRKAEFLDQVEKINQKILAIHDEIIAVQPQPELWYPLFLKVNGQFWDDISHQLMALVEVGRSAFDLAALRKLQEVASQVERHHLAVQRTITEFVPWIPLFEDIPELLKRPQYADLTTALKTTLPYNLTLSQIRQHSEIAIRQIRPLNTLLLKEDSQAETSIISPLAPNQTLLKEKALQWIEELRVVLHRAAKNSDGWLKKFNQISFNANQFMEEMDFSFLYQSERRVFHIGYNIETGTLDQNFYDLLASEARIASIIAIAKGEVPQSHWLHLGRPLTRIEGSYALLSWSGTMFEYLMPSLFLRSYPGTLLAESTRGAVLHQITYGKTKNVPWGISESGFYRFDANQNYQYRAFGVPGLGFKRGLGNDLVIAPYASLMAVSFDPHAVVRNLAELIRRKALGIYGMYEAIDFTIERLLLGESSAMVSEYMAHHQGMILMAMDNFFHKDIMIERMHSSARIQSVDLLLQEQAPHFAPLQEPYEEDVKGVKRVTAGHNEIVPWNVPVHTPIPQMHLLSNGSYNVFISNMGGGFSTWHDVDLTRWQADGVLDPWGTWIYIQEKTDESQGNSKIWSAAHQPIHRIESTTQVAFAAHMAVFRRTENDITSTMEVTVTPDDPVEIRRIHLQNNLDCDRTLRVTSYGEVTLSPQAGDARHPAFNKLFIESEFVPELNLQIFKRRPRSDDETCIFMGHMLIMEKNQKISQHEADRYRFIGRGNDLRNPICLTGKQFLSGSTGATLDPILAIGQEIELKPHESSTLAYLTFTGNNREEIIALAKRYHIWPLLERSFHQADVAAQTWLSKQEISAQFLQNTLQILSAMLYPFKLVRALPETLTNNRLGQSGLWRFGISGDSPILLAELDSSTQIELVHEVLQVHKFLRNRGFMMDLVIINEQQSNYGAELNGMLYRLVSKLNGEEWLNQRGGIYILYSDQMKPEEHTLLQVAAKVLLRGESGSMSRQIPDYLYQVLHLPFLIPTRQAKGAIKAGQAPQTYPLKKTAELQFFNGFGGFSANGKEYVINLPPGKKTPTPWVNIIGYPEFGFMVSEAGSQCTWAVNSGENRLTPWSNDPVCDPTGEALYLRDEETGEVWSPTPLPSPDGQPYRVTHGAGYTLFEHNSHGLRQSLKLFASPEDPVKVIHLSVENTLPTSRRITATQFVEWVLGTTHAANLAYIIPEYDLEQECLMASNPYNAEFGSRVAFLIASKAVHGLTADRAEFFGRGGTPAFPAALRRMGLETRITPGEDPCAIMQLHLDLLPGATEEIYFVLGQGEDREHALALARKYHNPESVGAAYERTQAFWDRLLNTVQVHTPQPATDLILNRWMLYQTLSCRIWGRTGFYQSSGAFGFRDQLQDVLALLAIDPLITRTQILNAARHQFVEGDVMHWWHPPSDKGVRTRISDNLLWLPYVTARYIEVTNDSDILHEHIPFLNAPSLDKNELEHYGAFPQTEETYSLMEHCLRAIEKGATNGVHGLPLIGSGDWNDGLNRVGNQGKGESIWLSWFICDVLNRFAVVCEKNGDSKTAERYRIRAKGYAAANEISGWDGEWYRRAYFDDGKPLGSSQNAECQIDAIAQSWSVLSGVGDPIRNRIAMGAVFKHLVRPLDRLSLLFTPAFDKTPLDPGYIKGYLPGTRENGGQYTHAAIWTAWAAAQLGEGKQTGELFDLLNPVFQADSEVKASEYRVEPYVICADIYSQAPYTRRGGWSWYSGSATWMYRLGLEAILGFQKIGNSLNINPVIPPEWDGFEIRYNFGDSVYQIKVVNPQHVAHNVVRVTLDGNLLDEKTIPLLNDQISHTVEVTMGQEGSG